MQRGKTAFIIAALLLFVVSSSFQCNKRIGCAENIYSFEIGVKAYPDNETMNVGDTLWLEINEPTTLSDTRTGRSIDYSNAENLSSNLGFSKLNESVPKWEDAADEFNYLLSEGSEIGPISPSLQREYRFAEKSGKYTLKVGIIPKSQGIFNVVFGNAANVYRTSDRCTKAAFTINFKETDQHYNLSPFFTGGPTPVGGDYYFKVY